MIYGLIGVFICLIVNIATHILDTNRWYKERSKLLDRIQSGSLSDFKRNSDEKTAKEITTDKPQRPDYL